MINEWQQRINEARAKQQPLDIRGGGSKCFYGRETSGEPLYTGEHAGIVNYEPSELVVTVRAGTSLKLLEDSLSEQGQMLAFEPPHFGNATVGGCVAAGLSGPRRIRVGAVRDFVLGTKLLDGNANHLEFGGQVMKNVAGYDISRFLAGSLGILGIITEVSLKVLPRPELERTQILSVNQSRALSMMSEWASKPIPISATLWHDNQLYLRLSGAASAVNVAASTVGGETLDQVKADAFWQSVKEQQHAFFMGFIAPPSESPASTSIANDIPTQQLWRVALPTNEGVFPLASIDDNHTLLEWNGTQRWLRSESSHSSLASEIVQQAKAMGGHATLFRSHDERDNVFTDLSPTLKAIHQRLKSEFDPAHIFNRGRMYADI